MVKISKKISITFMTLIITFLSIVSTVLPVSATVEEVAPMPEAATESTWNDSNPADLPEVTTDELEAKIDQKANQIIELMQKIGKPICIVLFIVSLIVAILGAIGKGGVMKGIIAAIICAVAYTCINFAQEIVYFIQMYLIS